MLHESLMDSRYVPYTDQTLFPDTGQRVRYGCDDPFGHCTDQAAAGLAREEGQGND